MKTYRVYLTVHFTASDWVEVKANDEAEAYRKAEQQHEISAFDADEDRVDAVDIECLDDGEQSEEAEEEATRITRDQIILPGLEPLLERFQWAS